MPAYEMHVCLAMGSQIIFAIGVHINRKIGFGLEP